MQQGRFTTKARLGRKMTNKFVDSQRTAGVIFLLTKMTDQQSAYQQSIYIVSGVMR